MVLKYDMVMLFVIHDHNLTIDNTNLYIYWTYSVPIYNTHPVIKIIIEPTQSMRWYILNLGVAEVDIEPRGVYFCVIHLNWGRIKNTNPRKNPERNPPIWAKLSTCGRTPTAKFTATMRKRLTNAATWKYKANTQNGCVSVDIEWILSKFITYQ